MTSELVNMNSLLDNPSWQKKKKCPGPDWVPAVVVERLGLLSLVKTSDRLLWKRHIDLLHEVSVRNLSNRDSGF